MSHKDNANLISTGGVAEALALNVDELVVWALVGRDGVDCGGGAGGGSEGKAVWGLIGLWALWGGDALWCCSGDDTWTWRRNSLIHWLELSLFWIGSQLDVKL